MCHHVLILGSHISMVAKGILGLFSCTYEQSFVELNFIVRSAFCSSDCLCRA